MVNHTPSGSFDSALTPCGRAACAQDDRLMRSRDHPIPRSTYLPIFLLLSRVDVQHLASRVGEGLKIHFRDDEVFLLGAKVSLETRQLYKTTLNWLLL